VSFHPYEFFGPEDTEGNMVSQIRELIARYRGRSGEKGGRIREGEIARWKERGRARGKGRISNIVIFL
jgi:hypothetical protein